MQILQVNKFYHPIVGGIESVVKQLAEGVQERGHGSRVLTAIERGRGEKTTVADIPVRRVSSLGTSLSVPLAPTFPFHLSRAVRNVDIVHYHLPNPLAVVSHFLSRPNAPTIVTYHSDIVRQDRALRLYRPLLEKFLDDMDHIITTSPQLRDNSPFLRSRTEKCSIIPLSVDPEEFDPSARRDEPVSADSQAVLFVGRLNYYKGVEYLIRAFVDIDATLWIAGDGDRSDDLQQLAKRLGISDRVHFLGYIDATTLSQCYANADVFVLPSVEPSEAFGIVQLEAMAHGIPVVNTNLPSGVPWVSQNSHTGITVAPRNDRELASAIQTLLDDPELRRQYGQNGRERVETEFTEEMMINRTIDTYQDIVG